MREIYLELNPSLEFQFRINPLRLALQDIQRFYITAIKTLLFEVNQHLEIQNNSQIFI